MEKKVLKRDNRNHLLLNLFEQKGKYENLNKTALIISAVMLMLDLVLCIVNLPYIKIIFNVAILISAVTIFTYLISDYKLEKIQKQILYLEDEKILNEKYIKKCLNEKDIDRVHKEKEKYKTFKEIDLRLVNNISLDILIKLREGLESEGKTSKISDKEVIFL